MFYIAYKIKYLLLNIFCSNCCPETILTEHQHTLVIKPFSYQIQILPVLFNKIHGNVFYMESKMLYEQGICDFAMTKYLQSTAWGYIGR